MTKYTQIYSGGISIFKEDDIFKTMIPLNNKAQDKAQVEVIMTILEYCRNERNIFEIMHFVGYKNRTRVRRDYIKPMVERGILRMTIPDKPSSKNQKYISVKN